MIPFSPPRISQKVIDAVTETLRSGWITTGPKTRLFEKKLTEYAGHKATLCVNSATAGLELMLRWYGVREGDEVIVPAYTYASTANVVEHCGARVVFADAGDDFLVNPRTLEPAITSRTKAIIPVDIAGYPCDYDAIHDLVNRPDIRKLFQPETKEQEMLGRILVLSDAAHSVGAWYKGKRAGNLSEITVFSFHAVKNLTTAEGGAVCLNLPEPFNNNSVRSELSIKSLHGQNKNALEKMQIGNWRYDIIEPGYKYNMTDIQAAMGLAGLEDYDQDILVRRKQIFDTYAQAFAASGWAQVPLYESPGRKSSYHAFLLRIKGITEQQRDDIIRRIYSREVSVNVHFVPLPMMSYYKNKGYSIPDYPVAYDNYSREISLPVYYDLTDEMAEIVIKAVKESVEEVRNS